ncbi:MAG: hypothetical protein ACXIUQ_19495 [Cecembia sp.]
MNSVEVFSWIFGPILITALAATVTFLTNFLNLRDRFLKWRKEKKESKKKIEVPTNGAEILKNPENFIFKIGVISNSEPGKCILNITIINKSGEVKFIDPLSYNFLFKQSPNLYQPPTMVMSKEKWPIRLEHGERFATSFQFQTILNNNLFQYWKKGVLVYATSRTTIGDNFKSNTLEYDKLAEKLIPLNDEYRDLARIISEKINGYYREVYVSLWQLQIFNRLTSHIGRQLSNCGIPVIIFLKEQYGLSYENDPWYEWDKKLLEIKIPPSNIIAFLNNFFKL